MQPNPLNNQRLMAGDRKIKPYAWARQRRSVHWANWQELQGDLASGGFFGDKPANRAYDLARRKINVTKERRNPGYDRGGGFVADLDEPFTVDESDCLAIRTYHASYL